MSRAWRRSGRHAAAVAVLVALVLAGACSSDEPRTAGGTTSPTASAPPADDSAEAGFSRDMAEHHAQAVDMADRIRARTSDPELRSLATDIVLSQENQIGRMQAWLELWGLPLARSGEPMAWMGAPGPMPGMATRSDLDRLDTEPVADAEVEFLQLMIRHHEAGVEMAQGVLDRSTRPEVTTLAQKIVDGQRSEIRAMRAMLEARGVPAAGSTGSTGPTGSATATSMVMDHG